MAKTVLIVEDERLLARTLSTALKEVGYDALVTHSAEQAEKKWLGSGLFDLDDQYRFCHDFPRSSFSHQFKRNFDRISSEALAALRRYSWPGNVRELKNVIERSVLLETGPVLNMRHLPSEFTNESSGVGIVEGEVLTLQEIEDHHVLRVLEHTGYNKSQAARLLAISRQSL